MLLDLYMSRHLEIRGLEKSKKVKRNNCKTHTNQIHYTSSREAAAGQGQ